MKGKIISKVQQLEIQMLSSGTGMGQQRSEEARGKRPARTTSCKRGQSDEFWRLICNQKNSEFISIISDFFDFYFILHFLRFFVISFCCLFGQLWPATCN